MIQTPYRPAIPVFKGLPSRSTLSNKAPIRFGAADPSPTLAPRVNKFLKHFDFRDLGVSHVNQIQIVYAACILWRLVAANERRKASPTQSWNEIRESLLRDSIGYAFWFFGVPLLQRLYLAFIPKDIKPMLMKAKPVPQEQLQTKWGRFKNLTRLWNPLSAYDIPTSEQVKDMKTQALEMLRKADIPASTEAFQKVEAQFKRVLQHRNLATGVGLTSTILLLGIGINYLNFYLTQKNMKHRETAAQKPTFPIAPSLPLIQPPPALPAMAASPLKPPQIIA